MDIAASFNFRKVSDKLTTSGFVRPGSLRALASQGYEAVVNLLPDTSPQATPGEQQIVESQAVEYIHIPVDFKRPTLSDFELFSQAMNRVSEQKVHVHCAANFRVSAFYSLYQVSRGKWSVDEAMAFIHDVWQPSEYPGWPEFIAETLANIGRDRRSSRARSI